MPLNEEQIREEIRRKLEQEEQARLNKSKEKPIEAKTDIPKKKDFLPEKVKQYLYLQEGYQYSIEHDDVFICSNHLGEYLFCTPDQLEVQNEYFDGGKEGEKELLKTLKNKPAFNDNDENIKKIRLGLKEEFKKGYEDWLEIREERVKIAEKQEKNRLRKKIEKEEKDKFYENKPEYQKYYNHLGEYIWMTEEDFRQQNEYYPPEETVQQKIAKSYISWFVFSFILVLFVVILTWFFWPESGKYAYVRIRSNVDEFRLLANRANFLINEKNKILKVPVIDSQRVNVRAFKPDYKIERGDTSLLLSVGDTSDFIVEMRKIRYTDHLTTVILDANVENAKVFVNRSFLGDYPELHKLHLEKGIYDIQLFKDDFRNLTGTQTLDLSSDTSTQKLYFSFEPLSKMLESRAKNIRGSIGISSNIPNASVYVNGKLRGSTNLVLDNLNSGKYTIHVEKKGYNVEPTSRIVELGPGREISSIEFNLVSTSGQLNLQISPSLGTVFMDGKLLATGKFDGIVATGNHNLTPQPLKGYRTPKAFTFDMTQNGYKKFSITYSPDIDYLISLNSRGELIKEGDISNFPGYSRLGIFREDKEIGPEKVMNETAGYGWMMGYALRFETPPGSDGIVFIIDIPLEFDLSLPVYFYWEGYKMRENYPITPSENHLLKLTVNGKEVFDNYKPKYFIDSFPNGEEKVKINDFLRSGNNRLQFSVADDNTSFFFLKKVRIH